MIIPNISRRKFMAGCLAIAAGSVFKWNDFLVSEDGQVQFVERVSNCLSDDPIKLAMNELALSWGDLRREVLNAGLNGEMSWHEVEEMLHKIYAAETSA